MHTIKFIATCAMMTLASACFAHQSQHKEHAPAVQEQKEWGIAGAAHAITRRITLSMSDHMRFTPDRLQVKQGETIRFVIKNTGKGLHELVIGTAAELAAHAAQMLQFPDMAHDEPYMAHVAPGKSSQLVWTFNRAGEFDFACLIAGHYQAGMMGKILVTATP